LIEILTELVRKWLNERIIEQKKSDENIRFLFYKV